MKTGDWGDLVEPGNWADLLDAPDIGELVTPADDDSLTVAALLALYLEDLKLRGARAIPALTRRARIASDFFGDEIANEIGPRRVYQLQQHLRAKGYAPGTVNGTLAGVRAAFHFGGRIGLLKARIDFPRALRENNARQGFIEESAYRAILAELPEWARDPWIFIFACGWRRAEVCSLRWDEVDLEGRVIRLDPSRSKNRESRVLPFIGEIPEVIERRVAVRVPGETNVFVRLTHPRPWRARSRQGQRWPIHPQSFWYVFRRAAIRAGHPSVLVHDARRSAYRRFLRKGVPEKVAREIVGWRGRRMPDRYNITSPKDLEEAVEILREKKAFEKKEEA